MMSRVHVNNHTRTKENKVFFLSFFQKLEHSRRGREKRKEEREGAPCFSVEVERFHFLCFFSFSSNISLALSLCKDEGCFPRITAPTMALRRLCSSSRLSAALGGRGGSNSGGSSSSDQLIFTLFARSSSSSSSSSPSTSSPSPPALPPREVLDFDVVIVGGGPAGLAAALRLKQVSGRSEEEKEK